jgi:hypothetical protein
LRPRPKIDGPSVPSETVEIYRESECAIVAKTGLTVQLAAIHLNIWYFRVVLEEEQIHLQPKTIIQVPYRSIGTNVRETKIEEEFDALCCPVFWTHTLNAANFNTKTIDIQHDVPKLLN